MEQNTYTMRTLIQWKLLRILALKVYKVICISSDVATYTSSYIPIQNKVVIIPNPINIPQGKRLTRPSKNEFIFIGRLVKQKDPVLALKSFHHFLENYDSNSILHIVGNGDLEKQLKNLSYKLNISKRCIFHGFLSNQDVYTILRQTTALISTSNIEGFAMVRFEALVNGNCLITTNTAGTEQYLKIAFNSGVFVASPNKVDFSDKMFKSTNYRYWEKKIIQERIKLGLSFSPQSVSSLLIKEFESIKN
jgi:glycosyltransferase involved in cell wall biosynthesis